MNWQDEIPMPSDEEYEVFIKNLENGITIKTK